jgi:Cd2+/Zn2+-exporting ATPase
LIGEIHMAGGMLVHEASVLIVILNGMRLMRRPQRSERGQPTTTSNRESALMEQVSVIRA